MLHKTRNPRSDSMGVCVCGCVLEGVGVTMKHDLLETANH